MADSTGRLKSLDGSHRKLSGTDGGGMNSLVAALDERLQ